MPDTKKRQKFFELGNLSAKNRRRSKRDIGLLIMILAVIAVFFICILPIINASMTVSNFQNFKDHYTSSMNASHGSGTVQVTTDTDQFSISVENASKIFGLLLDVGMGKPQQMIPNDTSAITLRFDDGAILQFWETAIPEKSALRDIGLFVRYESLDGYVYQYDTDRLTLSSVINYLK